MIMSLSDTIMVLQEGRLIADGEPEAIYRNQAVQEAYLGGGTRRE
jgi:branched-chain amino acid transport system ATP-binding protein